MGLLGRSITSDESLTCNGFWALAHPVSDAIGRSRRRLLLSGQEAALLPASTSARR